LTRPVTLGVLADWLEGSYQSAVVGGAVEAARESGVNLVLLADSISRATFPLGQRRHVVYDLGCSENIDGLLVMAGTIGNSLGLEALTTYCEQYRPRPLCSIGAPLKGMTGIVVAGEKALREGIRHLVEAHGYQRIAFLGGPTENLEARERLRIFSEVVAEYGLMPPDSLVVYGAFRYQSGADAVRVLLDERREAFDAIVAASDSLALGAIDALRVRKIRVPHDVAVVGFDDISEARFSSPPLTTIRQPLRQQGRLAVEILLRRLRGERVDDVFVLPCELVVRRSCGCQDVENVDEDEVVHRLIVERRRRSRSEATEILSAAYDLESLAAKLRETLPQIGVPSACIVLSEGVSPAGARVVFAQDPARDPAELEQLRHARVQPTSLPDGLLPPDRTCAMVVEPLFFNDDPLGYAVLEMRPEDAFIFDAYGALRLRISGALKVALLVEELQMRVGELRQAQKMETLGQLSGAIAHDFNNMLQAIRGYAELATIAEPGSGEVAADLQEIVRAADRASQLTRQLLTFSQPTRANARVVDVNECVEEAIPMIRRLLGPSIELAAVLGPDAGSVVIDPAQLEQAIVNLCVNGRDAMPEGGTLTIKTGRRLAAAVTSARMTALRTDPAVAQPSSPAMTFVEVSDTGVGIRPEIKDRIFEPFFTTKNIGQGTGLGLSIVYGILRNASGEIVVESEPGRGARFALMFPTSDAAEEAWVPRHDQPVRGTETILLVEDELPIRKLAQRVLEDAGYLVLSAADGVEARELWAATEGRVDLLLSDVTMPGLSGIAFAAELAAGGKPPRTLFISGHLPGERGGLTLPKGAVLLPKPFSVSALLEAVRAALDAPATAPAPNGQ
jgi:signal transduction histidine kinase/DNA-binding LacI/PurR family transcriptional regulator